MIHPKIRGTGGELAAQLEGMPHGLSAPRFCKLKFKYRGINVLDGYRLEMTEDENAKLQKLLAEQMFDNAKLRDVNPKKVAAQVATRHARAHQAGTTSGESAPGV